MFTNFQDGVTSFGIPQIGYGIPPMIGKTLVIGGNSSFIAPDYGNIQDGVTALGDGGGMLLVQPGSYDETVSLVRSATSTGPIAIVGLGSKGDVGISPSTANAGAMINDRDDVTLINLDMNANGTGTAFINTGSRLRAYNCKFENDDGTGLCAQMTIQTVAQRAAHTKGNGADCRLERCEFAWAASGVEVTGTDQGAVTELQIVGCWFHDIDTTHILESVGSGGSAAVTYATLLLQGNVHSKDEAGTAPTHYVLLNADNGNTGLQAGCYFPEAINGGLVLTSTALITVGSYFTGGINAAQPS